MQKMKRGLAVTLAATMVMGSSLTAFAEDPVTQGSTTGAGTSEGHVDKHVINVVLPTIADGSTPFAYTMDAERLIQETEGAKYSNATFPATASDTGVYFLAGKTEATTKYTKVDTAPGTYTGSDFAGLAEILTQEQYDALDDTDGEKSCYQSEAVPAGVIYDNTSEALKVTSKSSAAVKLTVEVAATSGEKDITLVDSAPAANATDPQLYLALNVGSTTKAIKAGETTTAEVTIAGKDENFETIVENGAYVYAEKQGVSTTKYNKVSTEPSDLMIAESFADLPASIDEATYNGYDGEHQKCYEAITTTEDLTWNEENISLTGAVSKASAKDLTAPELTVTWKYEDPAAAPAEPETPDTPVTPEEIFSFTELAANKNEVVVNGVAADATVTKVVLKRKSGQEIDITANTTGAPTVSWLTKEGADGELILKVSATIITNTNNAGSTIDVEFSDGKKGTLTIPE